MTVSISPASRNVTPTTINGAVDAPVLGSKASFKTSTPNTATDDVVGGVTRLFPNTSGPGVVVVLAMVVVVSATVVVVSATVVVVDACVDVVAGVVVVVAATVVVACVVVVARVVVVVT
jgi:hypothetical protein